ncbi:MAG: SufD family Fe-S cluster assembly protein [Puniceicoccales bacterium]|jgi:Fe-S cluster assembly protein SufD|nr:SufD family Fe-S cluster assembly protein [Puniceicoccales bacterium]
MTSVIQNHLKEIVEGRGDFFAHFRGCKASVGENMRLVMRRNVGICADIFIEEKIAFDLVILADSGYPGKFCVNFRLCEGSQLKCLVFSEFCKKLEISISSTMNGKNSKSEIGSFFIGKNHSKQIFSVSQTHNAAGSTSKVVSKAVLDDCSIHEFRGNVNISEAAENSDAHQKNENILLSNQAFVKSSPTLNILNNNVKCSHGATVGSVDASTIFYMRSRGIPMDTCKQLITDGMLLSMLG